MKINNLNLSSDTLIRVSIVTILMIIAISTRLMPHPANFTSVAAVALLGGSLLPRKWALSLPLIIMIASDLIIGLHPLVAFTWGSFALIAFLGHRYLRNVNAGSVVVASLGSSILFYIISNFGVWLQGQMYTMNWSGLVACYYNAIPFFRNTMAGDLVYSAVLFGAYALAINLAKLPSTQAATEKAE